MDVVDISAVEEADVQMMVSYSHHNDYHMNKQFQSKNVEMKSKTIKVAQNLLNCPKKYLLATF